MTNEFLSSHWLIALFTQLSIPPGGLYVLIALISFFFILFTFLQIHWRPITVSQDLLGQFSQFFFTKY